MLQCFTDLKSFVLLGVTLVYYGATVIVVESKTR